LFAVFGVRVSLVVVEVTGRGSDLKT
jgi:hypothetical protein